MSRLIFQLKIFKYEYIEKRTIVYLDQSGLAMDVQELLLNTPSNSAIVLDNATFHKRSDAIEVINLVGHY